MQLVLTFGQMMCQLPIDWNADR